MISHALARLLYDYDPKTGIVTHRFNRSPRARQGKRAGGVNPTNGYRDIKADKVRMLEHRFIYFWMTGSLPKADIDHVNNVRDDNRWDNLRAVSHKENQQNRIDTKRNGGLYDKNARRRSRYKTDIVYRERMKEKYRRYYQTNGRKDR